jgi:hypothetical protein
VIDVGAIGQEHVGKGALVLVVAVRLERAFFACGSTGTASCEPTLASLFDSIW